MKKRTFIISLIIPLLVGAISAFITNNQMETYSNLNTPLLAPPGWLFPIVWTLLYILMGISSYLVREDDDALNIYKVNLVLNLAWTFIFFTFNMKILAFLWIILLIVIVCYMIYKFFKVKKIAAYLQIPYLIWLLFASFLNLLEIL